MSVGWGGMEGRKGGREEGRKGFSLRSLTDLLRWWVGGGAIVGGDEWMLDLTGR